LDHSTVHWLEWIAWLDQDGERLSEKAGNERALVVAIVNGYGESQRLEGADVPALVGAAGHAAPVGVARRGANTPADGRAAGEEGKGGRRATVGAKEGETDGRAEDADLVAPRPARLAVASMPTRFAPEVAEGAARASPAISPAALVLPSVAELPATMAPFNRAVPAL
jgi:hypothetical protein